MTKFSVNFFRYGFEYMYLTTTDKKEFYERLNYEVCEPVQQFGGCMAHAFNTVSQYISTIFLLRTYFILAIFCLKTNTTLRD